MNNITFMIGKCCFPHYYLHMLLALCKDIQMSLALVASKDLFHLAFLVFNKLAFLTFQRAMRHYHNIQGHLFEPHFTLIPRWISFSVFHRQLVLSIFEPMPPVKYCRVQYGQVRNTKQVHDGLFPNKTVVNKKNTYHLIIACRKVHSTVPAWPIRHSSAK